MEEIYVNFEYDKSVHSRSSTNQTGPRSSERRFYGAAVLCLGLLSVFLLVGLISLGVHYHNSVRYAAAELFTIKTNMTERFQDFMKELSSLSAERDQLNSSLMKMTEAKRRFERICRQNKTCPAGWTMFSCFCYFLSNDAGSWTKGREDSRSKGADLVVVDSAEEQTFLSGLTTAETWSWIGLTDREEEGTWKWIDGASLTRSYWEENQPDNGGGDTTWGEEECAHIRTGKKTEENWNDRSCNASLRWICEKMAQH
ncbi:CD209 antigen-like protein C [Channa argus]|uniref:CD209 antigen-like protein C n=1 Tax=Channa argus TaxID=215402 RepID=UPI0035228E5F